MALRTVTGRVFRLPRPGRGLALSFARPLWVSATLALLALIGVLGHLLHPGPVARFAGAFVIVALVSARGLERHALIRWKLRSVNPSFRIATLRPFKVDASSLFRHLVAPILGCYGHVEVITDKTFERSGHWGNDGVLDLDRFGDAGLATRAPDDSWEKTVLSLLAISDLAVIDLSVPSRNLLRELAACGQLLPSHRVFVIGISRLPWDRLLTMFREGLKDGLPGNPVLSKFTVREPILYGGGLFGTWRFRVGVYRAMRELRTLDQCAETDAWRPTQLFQDSVPALRRLDRNTQRLDLQMGRLKPELMDRWKRADKGKKN